MRSLAVDFDVTVLWPLIVAALIVFGNSIRAHLLSKSQGGKDWTAIYWIRISVAALLVFCAVMMLDDTWKVAVASGFWRASQMVSVFTVIAAILATWYYASKLDGLRVGICLLVMLLAAASAEHFYHQTINAHHQVCPNCNDDDDRPNDDP